MNYPDFEEKSMAAVHLNNARKYWDRVFLTSKYKDGRHTSQWHSQTRAQLSQDGHKLDAAWRALGLKPQDKVAILGKNRPRWVTSAVSLIAGNHVFVTVYPTLTAEGVEYNLKDSGAKFIVVDTVDQAKKVLSVFDRLENLQKIFVMDPMDQRDDERVASYDDLLKIGEDKIDLEAMYKRVREIKGDDLVSIIYTSGTTGEPKGVMLTNDNYLSQRSVVPLYKFTEDDVFLNHLPFCHSFGLTADLFGCGDVGAELAIAEGLAPDQIRHALTSIRPTVLMSVPRLFEKLFVQVHQVVSQRPAKVQKLFESALNVGKTVFDVRNEGKSLSLGLKIKYKLANRLLMKVRKKAGMDRIRVAYAGGGPTSKELCYFFQSLGIELYQGYGLTETSPIATVNIPGKNKLGTVGPAIEDVEIKIAKDGEILIRGDNIMKGYLNKPEATKKAIDKDGWFFSGDIGFLDDQGYLTITDRKKEIIITSGGKNIAPLPIESAFNTEAYIERVVVIGDGRKYLSALVCPNFELLYGWAKEKGLDYKSDADLAAHPEVKRLIQERVDAVNGTLPRFQQIKKFALMDHIFSEETDELTPTQKVKRRVIIEKYEKEIISLYPDK